MPLDLTSNLISEAIGIIFTVFIVDKLIALRNKNRWKGVNEMFLSYGRKPVNKVIEAYQQFLLEVESNKKRGQVHNTTDRNKNLLMRGGYYTSSSLLFLFLGDPVGTKMMEFASNGNTKQFAEMQKYLVPFLTEGLRELTPDAWQVLLQKLELPINKLNELFDRFPSMVAPELAEPIIRLSIEVENLQDNSYKYKTNEAKDEIWFLGVAMSLSYSIIYAMRLYACFNS